MAGYPPASGSAGANAVANRWTSDFALKPQEEMVIGNDFDEPEGVQVTGNTVTARQIPKINASALAGSGEGTSPTYTTTAFIAVTGTPSAYTVAAQMPQHLKSRMGSSDFDRMSSQFKRQMLFALDEAADANICAAAVAGFSTVKGPGNIDKSMLLDAQGSLLTNAANHAKQGETPVFFKFHPSQWKYLMNITEITSAEYRGDDNNPNVRGKIIKAWNLSFAETANIYFSGGFYYNAMHTQKAALIVWNTKPTINPDQQFEFTSRFFGFTDACAFEQFDEDGVNLKSA